MPEIEVRGTSGVPVDGTAFACMPAAVQTPCVPLYEEQQSSIYVWSEVEGIVEIRLSRNSDMVEGGTTAVLELQFGSEGPLIVNAKEVRSGIVAQEQFPLDGWIEPVATARTPDGRNAGRFSLTFDWGTIEGTYDSADAPPVPLPE